MNKKSIILIIIVVLAVLAAGAAVWIYYHSAEEPAEQSVSESEQEAQECEFPEEHGTNSVIYFEGEVPPADPLMVGRWTSVEQAGWHKVYYDDDDGEGRYWGKEWDEGEDVLEEDLSYHGNGWFRWTKSQDTLYEYSTMDFRDVPIAHIYLITMQDSLHIAMAESNGRSVYSFIKE